MSNSSYPPPGQHPYMPYSPPPQPPAKPKRTIGGWIKLGLMVFGGVVLSCVVISAVLGIAFGTSPAEKTQTAVAQNLQASAVPIAAGGVGGERVPTATAAPLLTPSVPPTVAEPITTLLPTESPKPTDTPIPSTPTPFVASLGESIQVGQWKVLVTTVATTDNLGGLAKGSWIVVRGSITNKGDKHHQIGMQELQLRYGDTTVDLNRSASSAAAKYYGVTDIGRFGGEAVDPNGSVVWAIAFDVSATTEDMVLTINGTDTVQLGSSTTVADLPPPPTAVPPAKGPLLISRTDFGSDWPFTVENGIINCIGQSVIFTVNGVTYGVNGSADTTKRYRDIRPIWTDNPDVEGLKLSLGPIIIFGLKRC